MDSFNELGLSPGILATLEAISFTTPTPIQSKTIPIMLQKEHDIIGLAQTGTGKTAAYGLPIIQLADKSTKNVQALILCPTRELCMQITKDMDTYKGQDKTFKSVAVYGGASIQNQIKSLREGCQVVVGTPGRILDLIRRKVLKLQHITFLILDEADEMLNMGFLDDIDTILAETPQNKRTHLFSATMPAEIQKIAEKYMQNIKEISVGKRNEGASEVRHMYYLINSKDRFEALKRIADLNPRIYGIIFCRTRQETKEVADKMISHGYNCDALHGDLSQAQRDHVMHRFRTANLQMLVATDVAARGLDVSDLTHIINYNLPDDPEIYLHRSGRTGRAGKSGVSVTIVTPREQKRIKDIEKMIGKTFKLEMLPSGKDICQKQLFSLIDIVEKVEVNEEQIEGFLPVIYKKLDWLSREELIKHFVSVEFNRFLELYNNAPDLNAAISNRDRDTNKRNNNEKGEFIRLKVNLGKNQNINPPRLIGLINDTARTREIRIGKIDIMREFSLIEVEKKYAILLLNNFKGANFEGKALIVDEDKGGRTGDDRYGRDNKRQDRGGHKFEKRDSHNENYKSKHISENMDDLKGKRKEKPFKSSDNKIRNEKQEENKFQKKPKTWEMEMRKNEFEDKPKKFKSSDATKRKKKK